MGSIEYRIETLVIIISLQEELPESFRGYDKTGGKMHVSIRADLDQHGHNILNCLESSCGLDGESKELLNSKNVLIEIPQLFQETMDFTLELVKHVPIEGYVLEHFVVLMVESFKLKFQVCLEVPVLSCTNKTKQIVSSITYKVKWGSL